MREREKELKRARVVFPEKKERKGEEKGKLREEKDYSYAKMHGMPDRGEGILTQIFLQ